MKTEAIKYNEIDFEENIYDFFTFLMYKGKPFTGILQDGKWIIEFKTGNANGRSIDYYDNGQIASDEIYNDGNYVEGKEWHPNGQIKFDSTEKKQWDLNGKLIQENGFWLYKNGNPKQRALENGSLYLAPNGDVLIKVLYNNSGDFKNSVEYYDENLHKYYNQLLLNEYGDLDSLFYNTEWYFWGWIWKLYSEDENKTFIILTDLIKHVNNSVSQKASELIIEMKENAKKNTWKEYGYHIKNNG